MKKNLLFLTLAAIALSTISFNKKQDTFANTFAEYGFDAINENNKAEKLYAIKEGEPEGANKDAGNDASSLSSKLGVQYGTNKEGETCMRFALAIPSLEMKVVFNRTLTLSDGTVSYGQIAAKTAYKSLANGNEIITPDAWNGQFTGADYKYFVAYTLAGIPESEYGAKIEVSAEVTFVNKVDNSEDHKLMAPNNEIECVEVYNGASINSLKHSELEKFVQEIKEDGFEAEIVDGKVVVTKYTGSDTNVVIPEGVTSLDDGAFQNSSVKTVVLPSTIETVGEKAFYNTAIARGNRSTNDIQIFLNMTKEEVDAKVASGEWDKNWDVAYTSSPLGWGLITTNHDADVLYKGEWHYDSNGLPVANK